MDFIIKLINKDIEEIRDYIEKLQFLIKELEDLKKKFSDKPFKASRIAFFTTINGLKKEITEMFLKVNQKLPLTIEIKDKFGNAAQVDGAPAWSLTDPALGALVVDASGMSAEFTPAGTVGTLQVQVSADADLGEGVKTILGSLDLELLSGEAVTVAIAAGTPSDV